MASGADGRGGARVHPGTDRLHRTHGLVAHDLAEATSSVFTGVAVNVGTADAGGDGADKDLPRSRNGFRAVLDAEFPPVLQDESAHVLPGPHCAPRRDFISAMCISLT